MRKDHGYLPYTAAQRFIIRGDGDGRFIYSIDFYMTGTNDTGDTLSMANLSNITINHEGEYPLDAIVSDVRPYEIIAFDRYLELAIYWASAEAGAYKVNFRVPMNVLPRLKSGLHNIFLLDGEHRLVVEGDVSHADVASGNVYLDDRYHLQGQMAYFPRYRKISRDLADGTPFHFPKNTAYIVMAPASTTAPTEIRLFQGNRRVEKGTWDELLRDTRTRQGLDVACTHVILDLTEKGADRTAMANRLSLEHSGGAGTMEIMYVTINFAEDFTEKAAASSMVTETLFRGELLKQTSPSVMQKVTSKVPRPQQISRATSIDIGRTRRLAILPIEI